MDINGLTSTATVAASNSPDESAHPSSGRLPAELTGTHQATTSQSFDLSMLDDWARIRGEFAAPDVLMGDWRCAATHCETHASDFVSDMHALLMATEIEPTELTTALVAHIDQLEVPSRFDALNLLFNGESGLAFDKKKLETLAASRWIECFPDGDRDKVRALIRNLPQAD